MASEKLLSDYAVKDGDLLLVQRRAPTQQQQQPHQQQQTQGDPWDPATVQRYFRSNPDQLKQLQHNNPRMAQAVMKDDLSELAALLAEEQAKRRRAEMQRILEETAMSADPLDPGAQAKIEEAIRMENVNENMETAIEYNPEAFGRVVMLYIDCEVNRTPVKAFVDSGAQTTIMSMDCAERCGISRLIDVRWAGLARGVGTAKIVGRVHVAQLKIGNSFFSSSFTILQDNQGTDLLLGLDMLKKHQCIIDLRENVLRIGEEAVSFLAEKDIPRNIRFEEMPVDEPMGQAPPPSQPSAPPALPPSSTTAGKPSPAPNLVPLVPPVARAPTPQPPPPQSVRSPSRFQFDTLLRLQGYAYPQTLFALQEFKEEVVRRLMALGYSQSEVVAALRACGGNEELAASYLFGGF